MKVNEVDVVQIPSLPELMALPAGGGDVPIYNGADNILYRIKAALLGGGSETAVKWNISTTYAADVVVEFGLKLWLSLAGGNTGNTPVDGSTWWVEVSKSTANGFGYWAPGVFTVDPSMVLRSGGLFYLDNQLVTFPFNSTDFEAEFAQNKWVQVAGGESGGGFVWNIVNIDSATTTDFLAVKNTIYLVDCTSAPVIARLPNVVAGNVDEFKFILQKDTHKLTITTVGGTQTICDDTSQIIATIGGGMQFKANGADHYCLVEDTRILTRVIEITEDRDFSTDGFENHILYIVKPNGGQINLNIPAAFVLPGSIAIQSRFQLDGEGSFSITSASGLIGNAQTQVVSTNGDGFDITWSDLNYYVTNDTRPKVVSSSITTYSLNELTAITDPVTGTFFRRRAASTEDSDFNPTTPTELSVTVTANPTDPWQVVGSSIIQGAIIGIVPAGNTDIFYNVRRTGVEVYTYVAYYKRTVGGVETLISQSVAGLVNSSTAQQLRLTAQHAEFSMLDTDYYVVRTFARKATTGTNPTLISILEGANPTRSTLEIPASAIAHNTLAGRGGANAHPGTAISIDASGFNGNLTPTDDTPQKVAQKFDDYVGGTIIKDSTSTFTKRSSVKYNGFNVIDSESTDETIINITKEDIFNGTLALNKQKEIYFAPFFQTSDVTLPLPSGALGNGQTFVLPFVGNGANTLTFAAGWKEIKNDFVYTTAKYWLITGVRIAGTWFYRIEGTNATAIANPDFVTGTWAADNAYIDIQFNTAIYGDNMATTPIQLSDITFTFYQNGGGATNWVPSTLTKTTGLPLEGGETVVRLNGVISGSSTGIEYCVIQPTNGSSIFNSIGVAMLDSSTTGNLTLSNQADIVTQLKAIVDWDTLLFAENYDTSTKVWDDMGDLATDAVADGAFAAPDTKTTGWSNGHEAVNFNAKTLTLGTYPLFSTLTTSIVIGEFTTEVGAVLYNAGFYGLEWSSGRIGYQGLSANIGVDRPYVAKKFISSFANKSMKTTDASIQSLLFQNGDSNKYIAGGAYALNKANIGGRPSAAGNMNGKIAFVGKTTGTPTPAQLVSIYNTLDSYYNILEDKKYILFEGDSLTYGIGAGQYTAYPTVLIQNLETAHSEIVRYCDLSISGNRWSYVEGTAFTSDLNTTPMMSLNRYSNANKMCIIWLGTNDVVGGVTAETMTANITQYINKRIANGCTKFVVLPIIPRVGLSGSNLTQAQLYNSNLSTLTIPGATIKYVDLVSDPRLDDYTDLTYYGADQIHLTIAGYAVVAELVKPKVDEIFWPA